MVYGWCKMHIALVTWKRSDTFYQFCTRSCRQEGVMKGSHLWLLGLTIVLQCITLFQFKVHNMSTKLNIHMYIINSQFLQWLNSLIYLNFLSPTLFLSPQTKNLKQNKILYALSNSFIKKIMSLSIQLKYLLIGLNRSFCQALFKSDLIFPKFDYFQSYPNILPLFGKLNSIATIISLLVIS